MGGQQANNRGRGHSFVANNVALNPNACLPLPIPEYNDKNYTTFSESVPKRTEGKSNIKNRHESVNSKKTVSFNLSEKHDKSYMNDPLPKDARPHASQPSRQTNK